jgi:hypothetical protein
MFSCFFSFGESTWLSDPGVGCCVFLLACSCKSRQIPYSVVNVTANDFLAPERINLMKKRSKEATQAFWKCTVPRKVGVQDVEEDL